jgi:hypothetical protein
MSALTNAEILEQLKNLPAAERLRIVESTVHELREDMERSCTPSGEDTNKRLARAAVALLGDYSKDRELTAFTVPSRP